MIPRIKTSRHTPAWQSALARAVSSVEELLGQLQIDAGQLAACPISMDFPLRVPRGFVARMETGEINDPLLRQVLPAHEEARDQPGFTEDPLGEQQVMATPGLLHKYRGRALLTLTGACAIHCRYCFRRHFPYGEANPLTAQWQQARAYLARNPDITEIILSGGDPLVLPDARLGPLVEQLASITHIRTLRVHSRLPIVLPERIDGQLLDWLGRCRLRVVLVVHCNHPNEIDGSVSDAMQALSRAGAILLNQSVLLGGINDDADTLIRLSEALLGAGILPYYLHQLDRVQGAGRFEVEDCAARELMDAVHAALPGYLVPRLVREIPGFPGKYPLWPDVLQAGAGLDN